MLYVMNRKTTVYLACTNWGIIIIQPVLEHNNIATSKLLSAASALLSSNWAFIALLSAVAICSSSKQMYEPHKINERFC